MKKSKGSSNIWTFVMVIGILLITGTLVYMLTLYLNYKKSNDTYNEVKKEVVSVMDGKDETEEEFKWYELATIDLAKLKEKNPEVAGWILFENEDISYPVMYSGEDDKYLHTTIDGDHAVAGSIFMEGENTPDFEDCHTIIYGHNMRNLSMFGKLKFYYRDNDYYNDHQYFQIFTEKGIYRYQIFGYEIVQSDSYVYSLYDEASDSFADFIDSLRRNSYNKNDINVTKDDKVITLSTCTKGEERFVVHGVRVDSYTK